jgi:hypothetical protein
MGSGVGLNQPAREPGVGLGWSRLAAEIARLIPREEVNGIWAFPNIRREGREWGTAVVTRAEGDRCRIYTARYLLVLKGKERGQFQATVEEVGSGPADTLAELLLEVQQRADDEHPPVPLALGDWFPEPADGPAE